MRLIGLVLALDLTLASLAVEAQEARKVPRIGWLTSSAVHTHNVEAFRDGMRALGHPDVTLEVRAAAGQTDRLPALAAELVGRSVEVIVTDGGPAAVAAKQATATLADAFLWSQRARIVSAAARHRLPGMYPEVGFAEAGGLMAYGPNVSDNFRRAAGYVDRILKGASPADLPIQQPTKFELVINLKTAKALGLTIPQSLLQRADQVIE